MKQYITESLLTEFKPEYLDVINESANHNVPLNSETHFKVTVVSDCFIGVSAVKRHQAVYSALAKAIENGVHALAIHTYTPDEWKKQTKAPESPNCLGGS